MQAGRAAIEHLPEIVLPSFLRTISDELMRERATELLRNFRQDRYGELTDALHIICADLIYDYLNAEIPPEDLNAAMKDSRVTPRWLCSI